MVRQGWLHACELDADAALSRWLLARRPALAQIVERGTWLDRAEVESFLNLALPGVDELVGLLEIERLGGSGYDEVVVDTAPTGHTLRLLAMPATFTRIAGVLDLMQQKHRALAAALGHSARHDPSEALIDELRAEGKHLAALLRDARTTRLFWVMLPETLSIAESGRALDSLEADGIRVGDILVNRLTPPPRTRCVLCDGRRSAEARALRDLARRMGGRARKLWAIPARDEPAQGVAPLRALTRSMRPFEKWSVDAPRRATRSHVRRAVASPLLASVAGPASTQLLIVGGKGGVGKSTCAATLGVALARQEPARRVLLLSTDPAHSIGDVLGEPVGDTERRVRNGPGNLAARELDAAQGWQQRLERYRASIRSLLQSHDTGPHVDLAFDRAVLEELFELAPPGMDEIAGMLTIIDTLGLEGTRRFDLVVLDTAPTGHALRLLAVPDQARAWVQQFMKVLLAFEGIRGFAELAGELLALSRGLDHLRQLLVSRRSCGFVIVMRPERLPVAETLRLIEWLRRQKIARRAMIVNGMTAGECLRCRRAAARERREMGTMARRSAWSRRDGVIVETDAIAPPPRGARELETWAATWRVQARSAS